MMMVAGIHCDDIACLTRYSSFLELRLPWNRKSRFRFSLTLYVSDFQWLHKLYSRQRRIGAYRTSMGSFATCHCVRFSRFRILKYDPPFLTPLCTKKTSLNNYNSLACQLCGITDRKGANSSYNNWIITLDLSAWRAHSGWKDTDWRPIGVTNVVNRHLLRDRYSRGHCSILVRQVFYEGQLAGGLPT